MNSKVSKLVSGVVTISVVLLNFANVATVANAGAVFSDVSDNHIYANEMKYVKDNKIADGFPDGTFRPQNLISRGELSKLVINSKFSKDEIDNCLQSHTLPFTDLDTSNSFINYICVAHKNDIISGFSNNTFRSGDYVTYAAALKIIIRTLDADMNIEETADLVRYAEYLKSKSAEPETLDIDDIGIQINRGEAAYLIQIVRDNYVRLAEEPHAANFAKTSIDDDAILGNKDTARVVIVEFSDYQSPFSAKFALDTLPAIKKNYINTDKIIYVYRDFPIDGIYPKSHLIAEAIECAGEQGNDKYYEMHDFIIRFVISGFFDNKDKLSDADFIASLKVLGANNIVKLDETKYNQCLDNRAMKDEVAKDYNDGVAAGVVGTPQFIVGTLRNDGTVEGEMIGGNYPYDTFKTAIEKYL